MSTTKVRSSHSTKSVTIGFSVEKTDMTRLQYLAEVFTGGNRSAFLRLAMDRMEAADRAQRLRDIQAYGRDRSGGCSVLPDEVSERVKQVLARRS